MLNDFAGKLSLRLAGLVEEIQEAFERNIPTYAALSGEAKADVRRQLTELIRRTTGFLVGRGAGRDELYAFARRVGRSRVMQNIPLGDLVRAVFLVEAIIWDRILPAVREGELGTREWIDFLKASGEVNAEILAALSASYLETKDEMVSRQLRELHGLLEVGRTITSTMDLDTVLNQILEVAAGIVRSPMGAVYLLEEGAEELVLVAQMGLAPPWTKGRRVDPRRSLLGRAFETGAPVSGADDRLRGLSLPVPAGGGRVRSALSCPILKDHTPLGGMELYDAEPRSYDRLDMALLAAFAPQAGVAIQNARLFELERRRAREMEMMKELAEEAAAAVGFDQAVGIILRKMAEVAKVERCILFLYHPEDEELEFVRGHGLTTPVNRRLKGSRLPLSRADLVTRRAIREGEMVAVSEVEGDPRVDRGHLSSLNLRSCLVIPLFREGAVSGVMVLGNVRSPRVFEPGEVEMVRVIAAQAAVAVFQAGLRQRIQERERRLQELEANERIYRERERSEAIISANPEAIMVVDRSRNIVLFNPAAGELFGWRQEEALGRHIHEVLYGEENPEPGVCSVLDCPIEAAFRGERAALPEMEYERRDGKKVWISGSFSVIRNPKRQIENVICVFRDITEQKRLQHLALVDKELDIAASIQSALLPEGSLENEAVKVVAHMEQARIVGGDWYDYWMDGERLVVVVGDAAGSGIPAALLATLAMSAVRAEAVDGRDPLEVMRKANHALYPHRLEDRFITIIYGELDLRTLRFRYVNAGHNDPYLIRRGGEVVPLPSERRTILGAFESLDLEVEEVNLEPGDRLFFYTDGVVDCRDSRRRPFGEKRLRRFLKGAGSRSAEAFLGELVEVLRRYCGGAMEDDFTLLLCDVKQRNLP
ncbi:SpoIIE family protein phosphatase [Candidatus Solincola sp.]|nr:SpoIIE family protein phosphatase [Actinomycetota bacterium]MDI7251765.1 SpoIIE family protein phosphatase [Actinomycetota bacterium]